ncbi:hypothetical protein B0H13DRAFT_1850342 [Mycena leptocephala]|nr:hypothetical protein B0H13DRAFT_1850342 [Mycena leptocephala]
MAFGSSLTHSRTKQNLIRTTHCLISSRYEVGGVRCDPGTDNFKAPRAKGKCGADCICGIFVMGNVLVFLDFEFGFVFGPLWVLFTVNIGVGKALSTVLFRRIYVGATGGIIGGCIFKLVTLAAKAPKFKPHKPPTS